MQPFEQQPGRGQGACATDGDRQHHQRDGLEGVKCQPNQKYDAKNGANADNGQFPTRLFAGGSGMDDPPATGTSTWGAIFCAARRACSKQRHGGLLRRQRKRGDAQRNRQHHIFALTVTDIELAVARSNRGLLRARLHPSAEPAKRIVLPSDWLDAAERAVKVGQCPVDPIFVTLIAQCRFVFASE